MLVDTFGTEKVDPAIIPDLVRANFQLTPKGIIESLNLRRPIYRKTAAYGHFGRSDTDFTWEATDKAAKLASEAGFGNRRCRRQDDSFLRRTGRLATSSVTPAVQHSVPVISCILNNKHEARNPKFHRT